jgi:hypothetical protein
MRAFHPAPRPILLTKFSQLLRSSLSLTVLAAVIIVFTSYDDWKLKAENQFPAAHLSSPVGKNTAAKNASHKPG